MPDFKCPGAEDIRTPIPEYIICPHCGKEIEIFSDEIRIKCFYCKKTVYRETISSCIEWCKFAKKCVGESKYKQIMKDKEKIKKIKEVENIVKRK